MNRIVFCGSMIADVIKTLPTWPDKGMLVPITAIRRQIGGAVCNSGVDLKTLDPSVEVRAVGAVGADDNGDFVVDYLSSRVLDCSQVRRVKGVPTSFTDVMTVEPTGERTFFNMHGADSTLVPEDIDVSRLDCDIFHFGYLLLLDGMDAPDPEYGTKAARLLAAVQAAGIRTSIDIVSEQSDRFARIVSPALRYCDYCIVNEIEGSMATGAPSDDLRAICEGLLAAGVRIFEYTPGFVHAKVFVSDDCKAVVGTINLDYRSFFLHFECAAYLRDVPAVADAERDFQATLAMCQEVRPEDLKRISPATRIAGWLLKVFAPVM